MCAPSDGLAQDTPSRSSDCTYATCALRMSGRSILAGAEGRKVGSFGFLSAPQLRPWVATSDSASHYLRIVEENYVTGGVLTFSGVILSALGIIAAGGWEGSDKEWIGVGAAVTGLSLSIIGGGRTSRARDAMQSAIWWYNGDLVDSAGPDGERIVPFVAAPQHRGRAGVVIGSVVGLAAGMAVSSRDSSTETAEGLATTLLVGGAGGLIGWRVGLGLSR